MLRSREAREPPAGASREGNRNRGSEAVGRPFGEGTLSPQHLGAGVARSLLASPKRARGSAGELGLPALRTSASPFASEPVA